MSLLKHGPVAVSVTELGLRGSRVMEGILKAFFDCRHLSIAEPRRGYALYPGKEGSVVHRIPTRRSLLCSYIAGVTTSQC